MKLNTYPSSNYDILPVVGGHLKIESKHSLKKVWSPYKNRVPPLFSCAESKLFTKFSASKGTYCLCVCVNKAGFHILLFWVLTWLGLNFPESDFSDFLPRWFDFFFSSFLSCSFHTFEFSVEEVPVWDTFVFAYTTILSPWP